MGSFSNIVGNGFSAGGDNERNIECLINSLFEVLRAGWWADGGGFRSWNFLPLRGPFVHNNMTFHQLHAHRLRTCDTIMRWRLPYKFNLKLNYLVWSSYAIISNIFDQIFSRPTQRRTTRNIRVVFFFGLQSKLNKPLCQTSQDTNRSWTYYHSRHTSGYTKNHPSNQQMHNTISCRDWTQ